MTIGRRSSDFDVCAQYEAALNDEQAPAPFRQYYQEHFKCNSLCKRATDELHKKLRVHHHGPTQSATMVEELLQKPPVAAWTLRLQFKTEVEELIQKPLVAHTGFNFMPSVGTWTLGHHCDLTESITQVNNMPLLVPVEKVDRTADKKRVLENMPGSDKYLRRGIDVYEAGAEAEAKDPACFHSAKLEVRAAFAKDVTSGKLQAALNETRIPDTSCFYQCFGEAFSERLVEEVCRDILGEVAASCTLAEISQNECSSFAFKPSVSTWLLKPCFRAERDDSKLQLRRDKPAVELIRKPPADRASADFRFKASVGTWNLLLHSRVPAPFRGEKAAEVLYKKLRIHRHGPTKSSGTNHKVPPLKRGLANVDCHFKASGGIWNLPISFLDEKVDEDPGPWLVKDTPPPVPYVPRLQARMHLYLESLNNALSAASTLTSSPSVASPSSQLALKAEEDLVQDGSETEEAEWEIVPTASVLYIEEGHIDGTEWVMLPCAN